MPGEEHSYMMFPEKGQIIFAHVRGGFFDFCAAMRAGGKGRMMTKRKDILVSVSVQVFELARYPGKLCFIVSDIGIEGDKKAVAVTESVGGIAIETACRAVRRDQL